MATLDPAVLRDFIDEKGPSYKTNSVSYIFTCPRCSKPKLYMYQGSGFFVCMACSGDGGKGFRGRPEYALAEICNIPLAVVKNALYGLESLNLNYKILELSFGDFFGDQDEVDLEIHEIPEAVMPLHFFPIGHPFSSRGADYLEGRGIPLDVAKLYDVCYDPQKRSVVFPVSADGKLVGWQTRVVYGTESWDEDRAKYVNALKANTSKGMPREKVLMFGDRIAGDHAVVCEGPIDALKVHLCGGNVATLGKAVSKGQIALLRKKGVKKIYLALDPDALVETKRLLTEFRDLEVYSMLAPVPYKDLGDMPMAAVLELFLHARRINTGSFLANFRR